jgi:hypothetical protein
MADVAFTSVDGPAYRGVEVIDIKNKQTYGRLP